MRKYTKRLLAKWAMSLLTMVGLAGQPASAQSKANGADDAGRRSGSDRNCPLAVKLIPDYYKEFDPKKDRHFYAPPEDIKFEGPRFLMIDGKPAYFFGTSGHNVIGSGNYPLDYVMKIEKNSLWP